jgi:glycosyltransferase involved in cell wall biosynthesis
MNDLVTVVIPALNEEASIGDCLGSVRRQEYRDLQVLVVDNGSSDGTVDEVRRQMAADDRIELLISPRRNIPTALNCALARARGHWLVRVDAHSTVPPDYVRLAVERLREDAWGGVGGRKDGVGRTPAGKAIAAAMASSFGVGNSTYHHGVQAQEVDHLPFGAYPVELVRAMGGWDERLSANEDFEFDHRLRAAGHRLLFDPRITIHWRCRQSIPDLFRQYQRYGKGKVDVLRLHPRSMRARHAVPPLFTAYVAAAVLAGVRRPAWSAAMLAPYVAGVGAASVRTARQLDSSAERVYVPLAFVAMHLGWGLGFWSRVAETLPRPTKIRTGSETSTGSGTAGLGRPGRTPG